MTSNLRVGDLIVRQKGPLSTHYMVYMGVHNGQIMVAENQAGVGVRYTSLKIALAGNSIKRTEKFGGTEYERYLVKSRIDKMLGRAYDLVVFNCEHFARFIAKGIPESKQVKVASNTAMMAGGAMLLSKNPTVKTIGVFALLIGAVVRASQK